MKIETKQVIDFYDLFNEAEKRLGWSWNKCCSIFHGKEVICSPESPNSKTMELIDEKYYQKKAKEGDEQAMAFKLIHDIMRENNLEEVTISTD